MERPLQNEATLSTPSARYVTTALAKSGSAPWESIWAWAWRTFSAKVMSASFWRELNRSPQRCQAVTGCRESPCFSQAVICNFLIRHGVHAPFFPELLAFLLQGLLGSAVGFKVLLGGEAVGLSRPVRVVQDHGHHPLSCFPLPGKAGGSCRHPCAPHKGGNAHSPLTPSLPRDRSRSFPRFGPQFQSPPAFPSGLGIIRSATRFSDRSLRRTTSLAA
jgi:hypothetical protein